MTALSISSWNLSEKQRSRISAVCPLPSSEAAIYSSPIGGTGGDLYVFGLIRRTFICFYNISYLISFGTSFFEVNDLKFEIIALMGFTRLSEIRTPKTIERDEPVIKVKIMSIKAVL